MPTTAHPTDQTDDRNRRRGLVVALLLHGAVVAGFVYPFLTGALPAAEPYEVVVEVDFREPEPLDRSHAASASERMRNEVKQAVAQRESAPVNPAPPALPTPPAPPILTAPSPAPEIEEVPLPPTPQPEVKPLPSPRPVEVEVPDTRPGPPPSAVDGNGAATGSGKATGAPDTGDDGTVADAGHGSSDTGEGLDGTGVLTREIVYRPGLKSVIRENGRIAINVCVNRAGNVVAVKWNEDLSTVTDPEVVREAMAKVEAYRFERDPSAPREECGVVAIVVKGIER